MRLIRLLRIPGPHRLARTLRIASTLVVLGGCRGGAPVMSLEPAARPIDHTKYEEIRDRWTRQAQVIQKLDTTLRVHATCFSPEFISVYVAKRAKMFRLPATEANRLQSELMSEWSKSFTFLIAASTIDFDHNDFDRANSIWRVMLENDRAQQIAPHRIRAERTADATVTTLFPFVGRFHRIYTITFPNVLPDGSPLVNRDTEKLILRIAGPLGQAELVWRLQ